MLENTQLENLCDIVFEKTKVCGRTISRTSVSVEAAVRRFLKSVMRNFAEFTRKHLCENLFSDKVKLCRYATLSKQVFNAGISRCL